MPYDLTLLHLSDIHFRYGPKRSVVNDDIRDQLVRDAARHTDAIDGYDAIIISGDIAFSGEPAEYDLASEWLESLCRQLKLPPHRVWVIPGNHDVNRRVVASSESLTATHARIRNICRSNNARAASDALERSLDDPAGNLLKPFSNYNDFAKRFECSVRPNCPYWEQDFTLSDGSIFRLRGMNSALISDSIDDTGEGRLVLGLFQATLPEEDGVEYMTACHHPPDWLHDADAVEDRLISRARIHLFGHKHRQRTRRIDGSIRVVAGAATPPGEDIASEPVYNLLAVSVTAEDGDRSLNIEVHQRRWSDELQTFEAGRTVETDFALSDLPREQRPAADQSADTPRTGHNNNGIDESVNDESADDEPVDHHSDLVRKTIYQLFSLPYRDRMDLITDFDLIRDEDEQLPQPERYKRYLVRAHELGQLEDLADTLDTLLSED